METPMEETEGNALQGLDSKATQRVDVSISPHPKPSRVDVSVQKTIQQSVGLNIISRYFPDMLLLMAGTAWNAESGN